MAVAPLLTEGELDALRQIDTCMVANAVETFNVRLRNTGFRTPAFGACFRMLLQWLGYAFTARTTERGTADQRRHVS